MSRSRLAVWVAPFILLWILCGCSSVTYTPTPVLSGLFPSTAVAGGPAFTLSVQGLQFCPNKLICAPGVSSQIYWNGQRLTTTYNTATEELSAPVTAQLIAHVGSAEITIFTPAPGGGTSNAMTFFIDAPANPAPQISSISPTSAAPGGAAFTLTVNGSNFVATSVINWNGQPQSTTQFVSSSQLTVQIPASYIATAGNAVVTVTTPSPGGGVTSGITFQITTTPTSSVFPLVISSSAQGGPSNGASSSPQMDSTGRFVAFTSQASNLVSDGPAGSVYVRDNCMGASSTCVPATHTVDIASDGNSPNSPSSGALAISADGRYVAFSSGATNLLPVAYSDRSNVYLRDTCLGSPAPAGCSPTTILISAMDSGAEADGPSTLPSISSDGRFVAFESQATDLGSGNSSGASQIYVRDTCLGSSAPVNCTTRTILVSADASGLPQTSASHLASISGDGRFVAFESAANATVGATAATLVQMRDTCLGALAPAGCVPSFVSIGPSKASSIPGQSPSISSDGRFIAFAASGQLYLADTCQGADAPAGCAPSTILVSVGLNGLPGNSSSDLPAVSATGRFITFESAATNLATSNPTNSAITGPAVYVRDTCVGATAPCVPSTSFISAAISASNPQGGAVLRLAPTTADGRFAAFFSLAPQSVPSQMISGKGDVFLTSNPLQ